MTDPTGDAHTRITPVILAGGQGTRLWPLSRAEHPKQFLALNSSLTLFQESLSRIADDALYGAPIIVTHEDYRFLVAEQCRAMGIVPAAILLEPLARNTAAAIAVGAVQALGQDERAIIQILPSDHAIAMDAGYGDAVLRAAGAARDGLLVTFGVKPTAPETGYGYIAPGPELLPGVASVERFIEKPDLAAAEAMLEAGGTLWNSGMFVFAASVFMDALAQHAPEIAAGARRALAGARSDLDFIRLGADAYAALPAISVDYAVMEHSAQVAVVPVSFSWSDLGSWSAVWGSRPRDAEGNATRGQVRLSDTSNSLVLTEHATVVVDGLEGIGVIATADAVYVAPLARAQQTGALVKALAQDADTAALTRVHKTAYRPWGGYTSLVSGERFQVKRLFVEPGKRLSLQRHHHRAEHWVVVAGSAEVTIEGETRLLGENESVYIPLGAAHRLGNPGKITLELIEVQTGSYLGEDDIIRIADEFGRQ